MWISAPFKVNCKVMPLRSFANFSYYWVVIRKNCAGPKKARGPRPWPIWPMRKSFPDYKRSDQWFKLLIIRFGTTFHRYISLSWVNFLASFTLLRPAWVGKASDKADTLYHSLSTVATKRLNWIWIPTQIMTFLHPGPHQPLRRGSFSWPCIF